MKLLSHDPKEFLLMNLKLVQGVQFSNPLGEILASIPESLEPTIVSKWQYRLMISLDGEKQFVEVVRDVKEEFNGDFEANDIWMFLDWLVENDLVEDSHSEDCDTLVEDVPSLPDVVEPVPTSRAWAKLPVQVFAILLVCAVTLFATYTVTPRILSFLDNESLSVDPVPEVEVTESVPATAEVASVEVAVPAPIVAETAVRTPKVAETAEVAFAAKVPGIEEPSLVDKLIGMRQEMVACQIRRDEYYLLNDEKGYSSEVARISELVKEIGQIRAEVMP